MLWPPPSNAASRSNFGSCPSPWAWNGPARLTVTGPPSCASPPSASIFIFRSRLPDLTSLEPVNVFVSRSFTSVLDDAPPSSSEPPHAPRPSASSRARSTASRVMTGTGSCGGVATNARRLGCSGWRAAVPDAPAQPRVVVEWPAARRGSARELRGLRAGLAVLPGPGDPAAPARELRQAQRLRQGQPAQQRAQHGAARRADGDRGAARRRAGVGALLHVRRRTPAVGLEPRAGNGAAGDRAVGLQARPDGGAAARDPARADAVRAAAAYGRAGRDGRRRSLRAVLVLARAADRE